ncbi:MAG: T9SS type A sorting domain-containing protein [Bacteroidales bacterium]|nr:T9SS type A sorting domain-containing protein [Bacteroidales bacterium]
MKKIFLFILLLSSSFVFCQTLNLPARPTNSYNGSQFVSVINSLELEAREDSIFYQVSIGNIPDFQRNLIPITISETLASVNYDITYFVIPDYLAIGCDTNYFLCPMTPVLAQRIANFTDCTLTTRKMVNEIYSAATVKLAPVTMTPSAEMTTVPYFSTHNASVWDQRSAVLATHPLGELVGGNKKDVVISNGIYQTDYNRVCIYGWHQLSGTPIQPLYNGHILMYADYSHGIRLVQNEAIVNGIPMNITEILESSTLYSLFSDEGQISVPYYPVPEIEIASPKSFAMEALGSNTIQFIINTEPGLYYYAEFSEDGINFMENTLINLSNPIFEFYSSESLIYSRIKASDGEHFSEPSEVLAASVGTFPGEILIVNGFDRATAGNTYNFVIQHAEAINNCIYNFSSCTNEALTDSLLDLNSIPALDYILGEESSIDESLNSEEQEVIAGFLDNGGRLFISGSEIAWDLDYLGSISDKAFFNNYLRAQYVMDAPNNLASTYYEMEAVPGSFAWWLEPVFFDDGTHGTYNVAYPDVIEPINGSENFIAYTGPENQFGGVCYEAGSYEERLVYLAIPFETIYPEEARNNIMGAVLGYLLGTSENKEKNGQEKLVVYPNPCTDYLQISIPKENAENCIIRIYDNLGRELICNKILNIEGGSYSISTRNLKDGIYKIILSFDEQVFVESFVKMKN